MVEDTMFSGESKNIEYKVSLPDKSEKYMKTIVAFANTQGGKLIVGVDDKTHQIVGVENDVLIINAHCHRNLLDESCIQVAVYDDRLEVTSPGGLYNGLTYEEVMNGHSKIRNKGIANIFSQMGLVEAWGSGIKRILNAAEAYGLPKPRFQEFDNMFRVELFRVNPITDQANQATNQANQDLERLDQVEDENVLSEKEIEILNLVRMQPSITQKEMANALDWNLASVKYYITKLKEKNYLKRQGSSQKGKWVILTKRD